MEYKFNGRLVEVLGATYKQGQSQRGDWRKVDVVFATVGGQYEDKVCLSVWNENIDLLQSIPQNATVEVSFGVNAREYNGRWYNDLGLHSINPLQFQSNPQTPQQFATQQVQNQQQAQPPFGQANQMPNQQQQFGQAPVMQNQQVQKPTEPDPFVAPATQCPF